MSFECRVRILEHNSKIEKIIKFYEDAKFCKKKEDVDAFNTSKGANCISCILKFFFFLNYILGAFIGLRIRFRTKGLEFGICSRLSFSGFLSL